MNFCKCVVGGHLTRDPELRYLPRGTAVTQFGIAVNRSWLDDAGNKKDDVCFVDCEAWAKLAETISTYFRKGDPILIESRLKTESWEDRNTHQKRSKLKLVVESFSFCGETSGKKDGAPARPASRPAAAPAPGGNGVDEPPPEDDSIPF